MVLLSLTLERVFPVEAQLEACCFCFKLEERLMVSNSLFSSRHFRVPLPLSSLGTRTAAPTPFLLQAARGAQPLEGSQSQDKVMLLSSCCHFRCAWSQRLPPSAVPGLPFAPHLLLKLSVRVPVSACCSVPRGGETWRFGSIKTVHCFLIPFLSKVRASVKGGISVFPDFLEEALRVPSDY